MNIVQIFSSFGLQVLFRLFLECFLSLPAIPRPNGIWLAPREAQLEFSRILKYSIVLVIPFNIWCTFSQNEFIGLSLQLF